MWESPEEFWERKRQHDAWASGQETPPYAQCAHGRDPERCYDCHPIELAALAETTCRHGVPPWESCGWGCG